MEIRKPKETTKYRAGASTLKVKRVNKKVVQKRKKNIFLVVFGVIALVGLTVTLLRLQAFYITEVNVSGARAEYNTNVQKQIQDTLEGPYLFIFPKKNIFIYPEKTLKTELTNKYTNLDKIELVRSGLHTLNVSITERAPSFYVVEAQIPNNIFIDNTGVIFKDDLANMQQVVASSTPISETGNDYSSGTSTNKLPIDFKNSITQTIDNTDFTHLLSLTKGLEQKGFHVFGVTLRPYNDIEIQITSRGGVVRANLKDDPQKLLANFAALRKTEPLKSALQNNRESINYIDLRFGNKVFYKFF